MLPFKLISGSLRCATPLASSQLQVGLNNGLNPRSNRSQLYSSIEQQGRNNVRHFSFSYPSLQAQTSIPEKPKKPVTPWIAFIRDRRGDILRQKPDASVTEITSTLAKEWRQMDKSRYIDDYQRRRDEHSRRVEAYENSLTFEQLNLIEQEKSKKRESRAQKEIKKTNPPTKPRNAANLFISSRSNDLDVRERLKHSSMAEILKSLAEEYRNLSDSEKQRYLNMQEDDRQRYRQQFAQWYDSIQKRTDLTKAARQIAETMRIKAKMP